MSMKLTTPDIMRLFATPLEDHECARIGCEQPRDDNSELSMCRDHQAKAAKTKARRPTRCYNCQGYISLYNKTGVCQKCGNFTKGNVQKLAYV
ncbi:hypothetical protein [Corynebacterium sp. A21]|uniref:hypothetical protein n=1 Tax=Corynebacterium sp. A21 TaxID=3457318 RepID=UPI003FD11D3C